MIKKTIIMLLTTLLTMTFSTSVFAYSYASKTPGSSNLSWYRHSTLSSTARAAAANAATTWNSAPGSFTFSMNSTITTGNINAGDTRSDVGYLDFAANGLRPDGAGVTIKVADEYTNFDILLNSAMPWSSGSSGGYIDYQGTLTHEFGHALGLGDIYVEWECNPRYMYKYATMYGYTSISPNTSYEKRTLIEDDEMGKEALWP